MYKRPMSSDGSFKTSYSSSYLNRPRYSYRYRRLGMSASKPKTTDTKEIETPKRGVSNLSPPTPPQP